MHSRRPGRRPAGRRGHGLSPVQLFSRSSCRSRSRSSRPGCGSPSCRMSAWSRWRDPGWHQPARPAVRHRRPTQLLPADHPRHHLVRRARPCPRPHVVLATRLADAVAPGGETLMFFSGVWDFLSRRPTGAAARHPAAGPRSPAVFGHRARRGRADRTAARACSSATPAAEDSSSRSRTHCARCRPGPAGLFPDRLLHSFKGKTDLPYVLPTEIVLTLLAIPGIMSNTYAGVQNVDPQARDAARGMGMRGGQVLCAGRVPVRAAADPLGHAQRLAAGDRHRDRRGRDRSRWPRPLHHRRPSQHLYFTETAPGGVLVAALGDHHRSALGVRRPGSLSRAA